MPRREGMNRVGQSRDVLRFAGKHDFAVLVIAVEQWADADGVARGDEGVALVIIEDQRELRVQHREHIRPVTLIEG
ncbi:hypothetical protein SDC9_164938 [bioreactor metagenome]|uniref:Uncharacterized protein n=1 Tax=bioreactor metagenome TaxID=1076179 RepID=A0A645G092_9ZZZZ